MRVTAFTKVLWTDGKPVGNHGAANVLEVDKNNIVTWVEKEKEQDFNQTHAIERQIA